MSFNSAMQFIVDFYNNNSIKFKISKIQNRNLTSVEKMDKVLGYAASQGYDFDLFDLIRAVRFHQDVKQFSCKEFVRIFGEPSFLSDRFGESMIF